MLAGNVRPPPRWSGKQKKRVTQSVPVTTERDPLKVREREVMRSGGEFTKIRDELGWAPAIPFRATAKELREYSIERCCA